MSRQAVIISRRRRMMAIAALPQCEDIRRAGKTGWSEGFGSASTGRPASHFKPEHGFGAILGAREIAPARLGRR